MVLLVVIKWYHNNQQFSINNLNLLILQFHKIVKMHNKIQVHWLLLNNLCLLIKISKFKGFQKGKLFKSLKFNKMSKKIMWKNRKLKFNKKMNKQVLPLFHKNMKFRKYNKMRVILVIIILIKIKLKKH